MRQNTSFEHMNLALILFSAISFLGYGSACFWSTEMKREYVRYGTGPLRAMIGALQLCAAIGLILGLVEPWLGRAAAGGLALMMLGGVGVRIRIKDTFLQALPATSYFLLNAYLCWKAF